MDTTETKARHHAVALRQCALFASDCGEHVAKAMTDAADFLDLVAKGKALSQPSTTRAESAGLVLKSLAGCPETD